MLVSPDRVAKFPRNFAQTDAVLANTPSDLLNASSVEKGSLAYRKSLEQFIDSTAVHMEQFKNSAFMRLYDAHGQELQIGLKVPHPLFPKWAAKMRLHYANHVMVLGPEFVEDMTEVTVRSPKLIEELKKSFGEGWDELLPAAVFPQEVTAFAQDIRAKQGNEDLYVYIISHYQSLTPSMKARLLTFLDRLGKGLKLGYYFDFGPFPTEPLTKSQRKQLNEGTNILVDNEGPTFIDTGMLHTWVKRVPAIAQLELSVELAKKVVEEKISPTEAFEQSRRSLAASSTNN